MGYIYKDSPDWREKSASAFTDSFSRSLEAAMLRKQQKSDEARKLQEQIALAGLQEIPSGVSAEDYESVIDLGGKKLGKPLTKAEKDKRARETEEYEYEKTLRPYKEEELKRKGETTPIMLWNPVTEQYDRVEGTSKKTQVITPPKADLGQEKLDLQKQKEAAKQAEIEKVNKSKSDAFLDSATNALKTIEQVRGGINFFGMESVLPTVPGTKQADWRASLNKLLAGRILDVLGNMKSQSRTGATGFGQLNAGELKVITDASTELKENLSEKRAAELLNDMEVAFQKIIDRESQQPFNQAEQAQGAQPSQPMQGGRIRVKDKASGQTGTIEAEEFDPNIYEKL
jgi:hypothetical protein